MYWDSHKITESIYVLTRTFGSIYHQNLSKRQDTKSKLKLRDSHFNLIASLNLSTMKVNIVSNYQINKYIKENSKHYQVDLGFSIMSKEKGGELSLNKEDQFSFVYNNQYKTTIHKQGKMGDINFYTDHYINDDAIVIYLDREEFVYSFDFNYVNQKGVDNFMGSLLKRSELELDKITNPSVDQKDIKKQGDAKKIYENPGSVIYEDIKSYLDKKNAERFQY